MTTPGAFGRRTAIKMGLAATAAVALPTRHARAQAPKEVKIALVVPLSGPWARQGILEQMGAEMAIEDINITMYGYPNPTEEQKRNPPDWVKPYQLSIPGAPKPEPAKPVKDAPGRKPPAAKAAAKPAVVTEKWEDVRADFTRIHCAIFVERPSQKKIIIGHGAQRLKHIGMRARHDIENLLGHRCHLELFVKVEEDWRDREHLLDEMGITR